MLLYQWREPADTVLLCQHVLQHGAQQWHLLGQHMPDCTAVAILSALRWHRLQLLHGPDGNNGNRFYTDWELCVIHLAHKEGAELGLSKTQICKVLATWLHDRTAAGIKQAYKANEGIDVTELLHSNGWPSDLLGLLHAWPGPENSQQDRTPYQDRLLAAQVLACLQPGPCPAPYMAAAALQAAALGSLAGPQVHAVGAVSSSRASSATHIMAMGGPAVAPMQPQASILQQHQAEHAAMWAGAWPGVGMPAVHNAAVQAPPMQLGLAGAPVHGYVASGDQDLTFGSGANGSSAQQLTVQHSASTHHLGQAQTEASPAAANSAALLLPDANQVGSPRLTWRPEAAAAASLLGSPGFPGSDFDLPEGDPAARQALEQHLDAMLADWTAEPPAGRQGSPLSGQSSGIASGGAAAAAAAAAAAWEASRFGWPAPQALSSADGFVTDGAGPTPGTCAETCQAGSAAASGAAAYASPGAQLLLDAQGIAGELQWGRAELSSRATVGAKRPWLHTSGALQQATSLPGVLGDAAACCARVEPAWSMPGSSVMSLSPAGTAGQHTRAQGGEGVQNDQQQLRSSGGYGRSVRRAVSAGALLCAPAAAGPQQQPAIMRQASLEQLQLTAAACGSGAPAATCPTVMPGSGVAGQLGPHTVGQVSASLQQAAGAVVQLPPHGTVPPSIVGDAMSASALLHHVAGAAAAPVEVGAGQRQLQSSGLPQQSHSSDAGLQGQMQLLQTQQVQLVAELTSLRLMVQQLLQLIVMGPGART